jgi:serine/threonine kinase PknH
LTTVDQDHADGIIERSKIPTLPDGVVSSPHGGPQTAPQRLLTTPPTPRKRKVWLIAGAITAFVVLLVAAILIPWHWLWDRPDNVVVTTTTTAPTRPSSALPTTRAAFTDDDRKLLQLATKTGLSETACSHVTPPPRSIARVDCRKIPEGPDSGTFWLLIDTDSVNRLFDKVIDNAMLSACPAGRSPHDWPDTNNSQGQVSCGTYQGQPALVWSDRTKLIVGSVVGSTIQSLYDWWIHQT